MPNEYYITNRTYSTHLGTIYEGSRVMVEERRANNVVIVRDMIGRVYTMILTDLIKEDQRNEQVTK